MNRWQAILALGLALIVLVGWLLLTGSSQVPRGTEPPNHQSPDDRGPANAPVKNIPMH